MITFFSWFGWAWCGVSMTLKGCWTPRRILRPSAVARQHFREHRCRNRQIFWGAKDFCPNLPKLARKVFMWLLPTDFLPQRSWRPCFGVTSKKGLHVFFCKCWPPFLYFEVKQRWAPFLSGFPRIFPRFSGIFPGISTNQNFWEYPVRSRLLRHCPRGNAVVKTFEFHQITFVVNPLHRYLPKACLLQFFKENKFTK